MRRRHRPTGCAKFFLVILIVAPIAFIGASLFTGKNPVDSFYEVFGLKSAKSEQPSEIKSSDVDKSDDSVEEVKISSQEHQARIDELEKAILKLEAQKEYLEEELKKCRDK